MKNIALLFITALLVSNMSLASNSNADVILGEWLSQEKDGKISIFKQGDKFYGKISWGKTPGKKDTNNPDTKLKKPRPARISHFTRFQIHRVHLGRWENL